MKKLKKQAAHLIGAGIITAAGTRATTALGGNAGLTTGFASMYKPIGTVVGVGAVLRMTKKLKKSTKKQKLF